MYILSIYETEASRRRPLNQPTGFDSDDGNLLKNWEKHQVSTAECEEIFFNRPLVVGVDDQHSESEPRSYALGVTNAGRELFVVFTVREELIRVISARGMTRQEREVYWKS